MRKYAKPLNDTNTLTFYIPYREGSSSVILYNLKYNNTFFNIDYLNNYFAFLTRELITSTGGGQNIGLINGSPHLYQYILTIIRISPGYYKDIQTIIKAINKGYENSQLGTNSETSANKIPLIGYLNDDETEYIEDINYNEQTINFTKEIIPVNINLTININQNKILTNENIIEYTIEKETTKFDIEDNVLIYDKNADNNIGVDYFNDFDSYNNSGFNKNISLGNYLTNIEYTLDITEDRTIPIIRGSFFNSYCYLSDMLDNKRVNTLQFNKIYSSKKAMNIDNLTDINIKYSYKNNINTLLNANVDTFNIVKKNTDIYNTNNNSININKKVNMTRNGVYIYCDSYDKTTQVLTNNFCFLYYSYID